MRRCIAALAVRNGGSRLFGKPIQNLLSGKTILDQIIDQLSHFQFVETCVLGISEGLDNLSYIDFAKSRNVPYVIGSEKDTLNRLILCGRVAGATDVLRITTENPFRWYEPLTEMWASHCQNDNDVTVTENVPYGTAVELYKLAALEASHDRGNDRHRSELCSLYIREHRKDFRVEVVEAVGKVARPDLRLSVDYPEDLVVCRRVFEHFKSQAPLISIADIVDFLDSHPELKNLVSPYSAISRFW